MRRILILMFLLGATLPGTAQEPDLRVKKVHAIFKTHLDIGFTELSSKVEQRYIDEFIPKAIAVAEQLRKEGGAERYVWTTGSWLVDAYLRQASPEAVGDLREAIRRGDIVWNGVPYTVESESMNEEMFAAILKLSRRLDAEFGKKTVAAKMTCCVTPGLPSCRSASIRRPPFRPFRPSACGATSAAAGRSC